MTEAANIQTRPWIPFSIRLCARCSASAFEPASVFSMPPQTITAPEIATPRPIVIATMAPIMFSTGARAFCAAGGTEPAAAQKALAPVENMIGAIVAITIGLGVAISGAVIVWGGIEKTLAGSNADAEHRAHKRIENGIHGLVWMFLSSVIVGTITALAAAYGLISPP